MNMKDFGKRFRDIRTKRGYTQDAVGAECSNPRYPKSKTALPYMSRNAVSQWESETTSPSLKNLVEAASFLECSIDYLVGFTDVETVQRQKSAVPDEIIKALDAYKRDLESLGPKGRERFIGGLRYYIISCLDHTPDERLDNTAFNRKSKNKPTEKK